MDDWLWIGKRIAAVVVFVLGVPFTVALLLAFYGIEPPDWLMQLIPSWL